MLSDNYIVCYIPVPITVDNILDPMYVHIYIYTFTDRCKLCIEFQKLDINNALANIRIIPIHNEFEYIQKINKCAIPVGIKLHLQTLVYMYKTDE